jgi:hypothetical protein
VTRSQEKLASMRAAWRVAITLANNICVQESDRHNGNDASFGAEASAECARRIRGWIEPTDEQLVEVLREGGAL